jgi:hypothetical protein
MVLADVSNARLWAYCKGFHSGLSADQLSQVQAA